MKLIDADKLIEKLSAGLDNPEELPVISIGTVMRMIDGEEEIHTSQPESPCYLGSPCEYQNPNAEKAQLSQEDTTSDTISRQAAIDAIDVLCQEHRYRIPGKAETYSQYNEAWQDALDRAEGAIFNLPSAQSEERTEKRTETHTCDCISRKDAILWIKTECNPYGKPTLDFESGKRVMKHLEQMPSAQPERTCVNCGRTANNGGWYADGGTRCPIEEHYALPKDGYCHLWEKRNVTDDDYPERRTDG